MGTTGTLDVSVVGTRFTLCARHSGSGVVLIATLAIVAQTAAALHCGSGIALPTINVICNTLTRLRKKNERWPQLIFARWRRLRHTESILHVEHLQLVLFSVVVHDWILESWTTMPCTRDLGFGTFGTLESWTTMLYTVSGKFHILECPIIHYKI